MSFALDPRLAADTLPIGDLALSRALLMNDARYPWLILVPRRLGLSEIVEPPAQDRAVLIEEIAAASAFLRALPRVDKLNVGALGNIVAQLHVHVLGRAVGDPPGPAGVGRRRAPALRARDRRRPGRARRERRCGQAPRRRGRRPRPLVEYGMEGACAPDALIERVDIGAVASPLQRRDELVHQLVGAVLARAGVLVAVEEYRLLGRP